MMKTYFKKLNVANFPFSVRTSVLEDRLDDTFGIKLADIENGEKSAIHDRVSENVFFTGGRRHNRKMIKERILDKYKDLADYVTIRVGSMEELMEQIEDIYGFAYMHYAFMKGVNCKKTFPYICCGRASKNLLLTFIENKHPNATVFYNEDLGHAHIGFSFVIGENEKAFVILDPTSEQVFFGSDNLPKNNIFVYFSKEWDYYTDFNEDDNLYLHHGKSRYTNLGTLRNKKMWGFGEKGVGKYFDNIFSNIYNIEQTL